MRHEQQDCESVFSRTQKESHESTLGYEIRMLHFTLDWLGRLGPEHQPEDEMFAVLESFLVHYRNLARFLSGKGGTKGDFLITTPNRWTEQQLPRDELMKIQKLATKAYENYNEAISTYLAHCTKERYLRPTGWHPVEMYRQIAPAVERFQTLISKPRPAKPRAIGMLERDSYSTATVTRHSLLSDRD